MKTSAINKHLNQYLVEVNKHYQSGRAGEHAYRGDFASLIKGLTPQVEVTNEPLNVTDCGNPDFVIMLNEVLVGFIEAKDIGKDLNSKAYKKQFDRYKKAISNLIITDYLDFQFYEDGTLVHHVKIGEVRNGAVHSLPENFPEFCQLLENFVAFVGQTIKNSKQLAEMMASRAKWLESILEEALTSDEEKQENTELRRQYGDFKKVLIKSLTSSEFADIYAQTLAYGMFSARWYDSTLGNFSRKEAAELIPKSNPFLRKLFDHVGGIDIDDRIKATVDNLADLFRATDVRELLKDFGKATRTQDPIIHFYETFLNAYDPKARKTKGVYYTPEPVVDFIVRGVDEVLKTEFNLSDGLADTSKVTIKSDDKTKEVHKVQVLDPATGTGTFLAAVVKLIHQRKSKSMQGAWSGYVEKHLIPRLNGFEVMMAPYAIAHLKMDMMLRGTVQRRAGKYHNTWQQSTL